MGNERMQQTLGAFEDAADPLMDVNLPDRGVEWRDKPTEIPGGLQVVPYRGAFEHKNGRLPAHTAGFVIGDVEEYLAKYRGEELTIPPSYSRFGEFEPHITEVSVTGSDYGFGITADRLESAVRFATGGGRYSVSELRAIICNERQFMIQSPEGDVVVSPASIRNKPDGFTPEKRTVSGIDVPEHDQTMLAGIKRLCEEIDSHTGAEGNVVEHVKRHSSRHTFRTAGGEAFYVGSNTLGKIKHAKPESEILSTQEYETLWGETFEYDLTAKDLTERVGDQRSLGEMAGDKVCIGHSTKWDDPRIGSRIGTEQPLRLKLTSYELTLPDGDESRIRISEKTRRVESFETKGDGTGDPEPVAT